MHFIPPAILRLPQNQELCLAWLVATRGIKYVKKKEALHVKLTKLIDQLINYFVTSGNKGMSFSLRLTIKLVNGTVKLYQLKVEDLLDKMLTVYYKDAEEYLSLKDLTKKEHGKKLGKVKRTKKSLKSEETQSEFESLNTFLSQIVGEMGSRVEQEIEQVCRMPIQDSHVLPPDMPAQMTTIISHQYETFENGLAEQQSSTPLKVVDIIQPVPRALDFRESQIPELQPVQEVQLSRKIIEPELPSVVQPSKDITGPEVESTVQVPKETQEKDDHVFKVPSLPLKKVRVTPKEKESPTKKLRTSVPEEEISLKEKPRYDLRVRRENIVVHKELEKEEKKRDIFTIYKRRKHFIPINTVFKKYVLSPSKKEIICEPAPPGSKLLSKLFREQNMLRFSTEDIPRMSQEDIVSPPFFRKVAAEEEPAPSVEVEVDKIYEKEPEPIRDKEVLEEMIVSPSDISWARMTTSDPKLDDARPFSSRSSILKPSRPRRTTSPKTVAELPERQKTISTDFSLHPQLEELTIEETQVPLVPSKEIPIPTDVFKYDILSKLSNEEAERTGKILDIVVSWDFALKLDIETVAEKPLNRLNIARAFTDLLFLAKHQYVILFSEENTNELDRIEKGPALINE